jgi:hypothetical protein
MLKWRSGGWFCLRLHAKEFCSIEPVRQSWSSSRYLLFIFWQCTVSKKSPRQDAGHCCKHFNSFLLIVTCLYIIIIHHERNSGLDLRICSFKAQAVLGLSCWYIYLQNLSCNMLYDTKYCWRHITKPIPNIVGSILQSQYQVFLLSYNMFVRSHCRFHYTYTHNRLYAIPSIADGILQSRYQVLLLLYNMFVRSHCWFHYTHTHTTVFIRYQALLAAYYKAFWA